MAVKKHCKRAGIVMKRKELFSMIGVILVSIGTVFLFSGCVTDFNGLFFGKEDTSVNWEMTAIDKVPSLNQLEKLSNLSKEASAIYRYADRAHAEGNKWYKFTAPEKEKEEYYAYKKTNGNSYIWEVYKKR